MRSARALWRAQSRRLLGDAARVRAARRRRRDRGDATAARRWSLENLPENKNRGGDDRWRSHHRSGRDRPRRRPLAALPARARHRRHRARRPAAALRRRARDRRGNHRADRRAAGAAGGSQAALRAELHLHVRLRAPARGERHVIARPEKYEHYKSAQPYSLRIEVHGGEIYGETSGWLQYSLYEQLPGTKGGLWTYRRLVGETKPHDVQLAGERLPRSQPARLLAARGAQGAAGCEARQPRLPVLAADRARSA